MIKQEPREEISLNPSSHPVSAGPTTETAASRVPPLSSQHPSLTSFNPSAPPQHPPSKPEPHSGDDRPSVLGSFLDKNFRPAVVATTASLSTPSPTSTSYYHNGSNGFDRELPPLKPRHAVTPYPLPLYYYPPSLTAGTQSYPQTTIYAPGRRLSGAGPVIPSTASPPPVRSRSNRPTSPSPSRVPTPPPRAPGSDSSADASGDPDELYDDELEHVASADLDGVPLTAASTTTNGNPHPRPPYSACMMIRQILVWSPTGKLRSAQLCDAIAEKYPFFQDPVAKKHLRDSVRHKLSNRPQFHCLPKQPGDKGKGGYWEYVFKDGSTSSTISWGERQRRMEEGTKKRAMELQKGGESGQPM